MLVHRFARELLRALGQVQGKIAKPVPEVLFVCVHNAGRSQMAAALLDHRTHLLRWRGQRPCGFRTGSLSADAYAAVKAKRVPTVFWMNASGNAAATAWVARQPVQCEGTR